MDQVGVWVGLIVGVVGGAYLIRQQKNQPPRPSVMCPHCQTLGQVYVTRVNKKRGISGGKATGALFTGGASMLLTGLSRKEAVDHMRCGNCHVEWDA